MPTRLTTRPMPQARYSVARKLRPTSWATAAGRIISALISSSPTTRIDSTTVEATSTASTVLSGSTGRPTARAYSSSSLTAYSREPSSQTTPRTTTVMTAKTATSDAVVVVIAPKR